MNKNTTDKFSGKARLYDKYRPSYSPTLINYLETFIPSNGVIADIGSGTGKLTELLLERGYTVTAVEPNEDMRESALTALNKYAKYTQLNTMAENTSIKSESINLVTAAQSFHWFDSQKFKQECQRILCKDGTVALIWNSRDTNADIVIRNGEICKQLCHDFHGFSRGFEQTPEVYKAFFRDGSYQHTIYNNDFIFTLDEFIGRNLSASYAPKESDTIYNTFIQRLTELFHRYENNGLITIPNVINCYCGKV